MKKILSIALLSLLVKPMVFSQKEHVNLDKFYFNYEYVELPEFYTDPANRTYNVVTNNGSDYYWVFDNNAFSRKININGFRPVETNAYINIEVQLENLIIENGGVQPNMVRRNDGSMQANGFIATITCRGIGRCNINVGGRVTTTPLSITQSVSSRIYPLEIEAFQYFYENQATIKQQFSRDFANNSIDKIFTEVNHLFGYRVISAKGPLWVLVSEENPNFQGHQAAMKQTQDIFYNLLYNVDPAPFLNNIQPVIKFYEDQIVLHSQSDDKKDRKMKYASYFNLMNIYYALDLPDKAKAAADALIRNDYDIKDGKEMEMAANVLITKLSANQAPHRHMVIDPLYVR